jgi:hypothetical protein
LKGKGEKALTYCCWAHSAALSSPSKFWGKCGNQHRPLRRKEAFGKMQFIVGSKH